MTDEKKRWRCGFAIAVAVHLVAALFLGFLGYRFSQTPPQILEVTLESGPWQEAAQEEQQPVEQAEEEVLPPDPEEVVDESLEPVIKKEAVAKKPSSAKTEATKGNASSGKEGGSGAGEGHGVPAKAPYILRAIQPRYPSSARNKRIEGTVAVRMLINASGIVENAEIAKSSGNADLDEAAVKGVYKWKFSPAKDRYGLAVPCYTTVPVRFHLK